MCKAVRLQYAERSAIITPSHMPEKKHRFAENTWNRQQVAWKVRRVKKKTWSERAEPGSDDQAGGQHQKFKSSQQAKKEFIRTPNAPCLFFEHVGQFCDEHGYDMSSMALGKIVSHRNCDLRPSCWHLDNLVLPNAEHFFFCDLASVLKTQIYDSRPRFF